MLPTEPEPGIATEPLLSERIYLAPAGAGLPGGDPAGEDPAGGDPVAARAGDSWMAASPDTLCYLLAVRLCQASGFSPRIRHHADDFATVLALVAAGQGVALVPELAAADPPGGVVLTALSARRHSRVAYRAGSGGHPAIAAGAAALRAAAREAGCLPEAVSQAGPAASRPVLSRAGPAAGRPVLSRRAGRIRQE